MQKRVQFVCVILFAALVFGGCDRGAGVSREPTRPSEYASHKLFGATADWNVLFITMDTTRFDRLGCYGREAAQTPTIDAIAKQGVRFTRAYSHAPITISSHTSMMTGTLPPENGVHVNGWHSLVPELPTLAEQFKQRGYSTGAFVAARVLDSRYGLARGFDTYRDRMPANANGQPARDRPANHVIDEVLPWLDKVGDGKFMCWVHLFDPHAPYVPPSPFRERLSDAYDGEVAFMDSQIKRLTDWLQAQQLRDKTLIVVLADHGESLGDHGYMWHALLVYESIMRVPLIFSAPGKLSAGAVADSVVGVRDVMPTILDLMGWDTPGEVSGASALPALAGEVLASRKVYGETEFPSQKFGWSPLHYLIDSGWKYIRAPKPRLYHIAEDPDELRNLAGEEPDRITRMEDALSVYEEGMVRRESQILHMDAEERRVLESLGYAGQNPSTVAPTEAKDPHDMVEVLEKFRMVETLIGERRAAEALVLVEPIAQTCPESFAIIRELARAYAGVGLLEEAEHTIVRALALHPDEPDTYVFLARVQQGRERFARAVEACEVARKIAPGHEVASGLLPQLERFAKQQEDGLASLQKRLTESSPAADLFGALADLLVKTGDTKAAIDVLSKGLDRYADDVVLSNALAWQLATSSVDGLRDGEKAVRRARVACRGEFSDHPQTLDTLAAALAEAGQFDEAIRVAERALAGASAQNDDPALPLAIERRLRRYRSGEAYRAPG